jgi:hypothetical protein
VLPEHQLGLDLHFKLPAPRRSIVQAHEQMQAYVREIREQFDQHISNSTQLTSIHVFAAVPVSLAFSIGKALTATWLPPCYVYNFDLRDTPQYKWRLGLREAKERRPCIHIFQEQGRPPH